MFSLTIEHPKYVRGSGFQGTPGKVLGSEWVEPMRRAVRTATIESLLVEAERIIEDAKSRTPIDTGALRSTGRARRDGATITMSFGGRATNGKIVRYAVYVHEITWYKHKIGGAKFLENAVNAARRGMDRRIANGVTTRLIQGGLGTGRSL